jgi:Rod binding domain-containing protein
MMMKSMLESIVKSELSESSTVETFEGMFDKEVSVQLAKKNSMGLADMLVKNLEQQQANIATTADILKQRQDPAAFNASAKAIALNPKAAGMSLDKLNPKAAGIALPPAPKFQLNVPPKPLNGSGS